MPSWVPIAASIRYVGRSDENVVLVDVKVTVVGDSFVVSVFGSLVMVP
jgi:hypothetical protein